VLAKRDQDETPSGGAVLAAQAKPRTADALELARPVHVPDGAG